MINEIKKKVGFHLFIKNQITFIENKNYNKIKLNGISRHIEKKPEL